MYSTLHELKEKKGISNIIIYSFYNDDNANGNAGELSIFFGLGYLSRETEKEKGGLKINNKGKNNIDK